ncbi:MAG: hypothetical protein EVA89_18905 [Sandaracinaceae bacterium]|nr:MAG: hypothetical protein EVA89_18905 [Sandaracinaceae bacterium]
MSGRSTRWLPRAARVVSRAPWGRAAGRGAYRLAAELAGRDLARIRGVDAVYLTGSVAADEAAPGWSDIDLFLAVTLPSLEAEIDLRRRLARWQRRANRLGPLFAGIDYAERRDLEAMRRFGDAWTLGMERRFRLVGGRGELLDAVPRAPREERLLRLSKALRRLCKVGAVTLREGDGERTRRMTSRLDGEGVDAFERLASAGARLGELARSVSADWTESPAPRPPAPDSPALARACDAVRVCSRDTSWVQRFTVCVTEGCDAARLRRLSEAVRSTPRMSGWLPGPAWLPAAVWSALAALEPAPIAGLSAPGSTGRDELAPPRWPSPSDLRVLLRAERVHLAVRARGRALRARRDPGAALARMACDVRLHAPALDQLTAGQRVRFEPRPPPGGSERALLGELRGWLDRARVDWTGWDVADA